MDNHINVVLLDFGGVIVPPGDPTVMATLEEALSLQPGQLPSLMYEGDLWQTVSVGKLSEDRYWHELAQLLKQEPDFLRPMLQSIWEPPEADRAVVDLIRRIRPDVRVSLLSNATPGLETHLRRLGVADLFDPIINSSRVGLRKPDPAVFRHALRVLQTAPEAVLFVDDKERNTVVAEELNIPSICFTDAAQLECALLHYGVLDRTARP
jgi:putative hydrolase of the HAD superfamily